MPIAVSGQAFRKANGGDNTIGFGHRTSDLVVIFNSFEPVAKTGLQHVLDMMCQLTKTRIDFRIHMGLRYNEPEWKLRLNGLIRDKQDEIRAILMEYGVPLLDEQGNLIDPPS